jgi:hypothetical protein
MRIEAQVVLSMNIFEAVSVRIPCKVCSQHYEVPLSDILLSNRMLKEGCPVREESECPPLFQTRLISPEILQELVVAWNRLENNVRHNNGELVIREMPRNSIQRRNDAAEAVCQQQAGEVQAASASRRLDFGCGLTGPDSGFGGTARDRGLDQTLKETFPCSDALSCIPDPRLEETA